MNNFLYSRSHPPKFSRFRGMTLTEILIVVTLMTVISLALYKALSNGLKVWERSRQLIVEEDVAIFLDKFTQDLSNFMIYSKIKFEGNESSVKFPSIIYMLADRRGQSKKDEFVDQLGRIEYYYDYVQHAIFRRQANYSQALNETFGPEQLLVGSVERLRFNYYYLTDQGGVSYPQALDVLPAGIDVEIEFLDTNGQRRKINKLIDIPLGA